MFDVIVSTQKHSIQDNSSYNSRKHAFQKALEAPTAIYVSEMP